MSGDGPAADLFALYEAYARELPGRSMACAPGCSSCCTQSVTMTTLEGEAILARVEESHGTAWLADRLASFGQKGRGLDPGPTFNEFARACLAQEEIPAESIPAWRLSPCIFLEGGLCTIYPVRPFACRSFFSQKRCDIEGEAEVEPLLITINTVFSQLVEHLDQGGAWGYLSDILSCLLKRAEGEPVRKGDRFGGFRLKVARPLPGFLIPPEEEEQVSRILTRAYRSLPSHASLADLFPHV